MIVELIRDFFAEYPATSGGSDTDGTIRQQLIEHLMQQIMRYDAEFRSEDATSPRGSYARH